MADAIIIYEDQIYCIEFKLDQSAQIALDQILERGYTDRFKESRQPIYHIGINFSSEQKKVEEIIWDISIWRKFTSVRVSPLGLLTE